MPPIQCGYDVLVHEPPSSQCCSVSVVVGLVGSLRFDADVVGLVLAELREFCAELPEVESGDLLVEHLGQSIN